VASFCSQMNNYSVCNLQSSSTVRGEALNYTDADSGWSLHSTVTDRLFGTYTTALPYSLVWRREKNFGFQASTIESGIYIFYFYVTRLLL
jgi:hypothetical protein